MTVKLSEIMPLMPETTSNEPTATAPAPDPIVVITSPPPPDPPAAHEKLRLRTDTGDYWIAQGGVWFGPWRGTPLAIPVPPPLDPGPSEFSGEWPFNDLSVEPANNTAGWSNFTVAHEPASAWGSMPVGQITGVRIRSNNTGPGISTVRLMRYNDGDDRIQVQQTLTAPWTVEGNNLLSTTLVTPITLETPDSTDMLSLYFNGSLHVDTRAGYTERYSGGNTLVNLEQTDRATMINWIYS